MKTKTFDSVKLMRDIRDRLSARYWSHPEIEEAELRAAREKHGLE